MARLKRLPDWHHGGTVTMGQNAQRAMAVPNEVRVEIRRVRYICYRLRTEADGGAEAGDAVPEGFREHYEAQEWFLGWGEFARRWDVARQDPSLAVPRKHTETQEWHTLVLSKTPILPGLEHLEETE